MTAEPVSSVASSGEKSSAPGNVSFIQKEFERSFVVKLCLFFIAGGVLFSGLVLYVTRGTLTTSFHGGRIALEVTSFAVMPAVLVTNIIIAVIAIAAIVVITRYLSRKTSQPLGMFHHRIHAIADGDLTVRFGSRPGDPTETLAKEMNRMTEEFRRKVEVLRADVYQAVLANATGTVPEPLSKELEQLLRYIDDEFVR